jgi:hypothetical protein
MSKNCAVCNSKCHTRSCIQCSECSQVCHLQCVNMTKVELDFITSEKHIWRCPPCSKSRRVSMQIVSNAEEGKASTSQVIFMLDEAKEDRKLMEKEMNNSFEFLHNLVKEQKHALNNQSKKLDEYITVFDGLKQENVIFTKKVKDLETKLDENEQYIKSNNVEIHAPSAHYVNNTYS